MLLLLVVGCHGGVRELLPGVASAPEPAAAIWQGFTQAWTYNHRLNTLGDTVVPVECDAESCTVELVHSAASGSGADLATFTTHEAVMFADGIEFRYGWSECDLRLAEGEGEAVACRLHTHVDVAADVPMTTLLNGFEVRATGDADKLQRLRLHVDPPVAERAGVGFDVQVEATLDCDSLECDGVLGKLDQSVDYVISARWLLVSGDLLATEGDASIAYAWDNASLADELHIADFERTFALARDPAFGIATVGLRGLEVDLDDDHHMVEWATMLTPGADTPGADTPDTDTPDTDTPDTDTVDIAGGNTLALTTTTMFKQWNANTWNNLLAYTEPGAGTVSLETVLLQARSGCTVVSERRGNIAWAADGGPSDGEAASYDLIEFSRPAGCD